MIKAALCTGWNYPGTGMGLPDCVLDSEKWAQFFQDRGFDLVNQHAELAHSKVKEAFEATSDGLLQGDRFYWITSGHGTDLPDHSGDEPDGRDEAIVTYPTPGEELYLKDDEINKWIHKLTDRGVDVILGVDHCFSGTMDRSMINVSTFLDESWHFNKHYYPPQDYRPDLPIIGRFGRGSKSGRAYFGACQDGRYSYSTGRGGAWTLAMLECWEPGITIKALHKKVRKILPNAQYNQKPVIHGSPRLLKSEFV